MRIALVSGYDWSVPGGVQGQVAGIASALVEAGHEVAVVAPRRDVEGGPADDGIVMFAAGQGVGIPVNGSVAPVAPTPIAVRRTLRALRTFRPDVVHVHEPLVPGPPLAACLRGPVPIVATFHRADPDLVYRAEGLLLGRRLVRRLAAVTAVSDAAEQTARRVLGRAGRDIEIQRVPNGVDVERFGMARLRATGSGARDGAASGDRVASGDRAASSEVESWRDGRGPVVTFVGRHETRKGAAVLLDARHRLGAEVRIRVGGSGPETESLRAAAAGDERVEFLGRLDDEQVADEMARADVVVTPAVGGESFGVVLLEAMAAGTPVVASDIPGYLEAGGDAARFFTAGDAESLGDALVAVLADGGLRVEMAAAGLRRAAECSMSSVARRHLAIYEQVSGSATRQR